jgi:hypothetical protein
MLEALLLITVEDVDDICETQGEGEGVGRDSRTRVGREVTFSQSRFCLVTLMPGTCAQNGRANALPANKSRLTAAAVDARRRLKDACKIHSFAIAMVMRTCHQKKDAHISGKLIPPATEAAYAIGKRLGETSPDRGISGRTARARCR